MLSWSEILIRLSLACLLGGLVGLERERKNWAAGLRTHMLVCVGASLIMLVSAYGFADVLGGKNTVLDPSRIAAQVISGIGFIGAGTILFLKEGVIRGLTTASGLWTVAAIGLATGGGMYFASVSATVIAIIILWILQPVESRLASRFKAKTLQKKSLRIVCSNNADPAQLLELLNTQSTITTFLLENNNSEYILTATFRNARNEDMIALTAALKENEAIKKIEWND